MPIAGGEQCKGGEDEDEGHSSAGSFNQRGSLRYGGVAGGEEHTAGFCREPTTGSGTNLLMGKTRRGASEQAYCVSNRAYGKRRHKLTVNGIRECRYHLFGLWDVAVVQYLRDNAITCDKSMRGALRWTVRAATEKLFDVACDEDSTVNVALHLREDGGLRVTAVAIEDTILFDLDAKGVLTQTSYVGEQSLPTDDTGC